MTKLQTHLKSKWYVYALIIFCAILLYLLLKPDKPVPSNRYELEQVNQKYNAVQDSFAEVKKREEIEQKVIITQDRDMRALRTTNEDLVTKLNISAVVSTRLAKEIKDIQPEDTSVYAQKVDALIAENQNIIQLNRQYVGANDSLSRLVDQQKATYEKRINDQVTLNSQMRQQAAESNAGYNKLSKDYEKTGKRLSTQKVITKSLVVVALVETAVIILKK